jgi:hypothetical protein
MTIENMAIFWLHFLIYHQIISLWLSWKYLRSMEERLMFEIMVIWNNEIVEENFLRTRCNVHVRVLEEHIVVVSIVYVNMY